MWQSTGATTETPVTCISSTRRRTWCFRRALMDSTYHVIHSGTRMPLHVVVEFDRCRLQTVEDVVDASIAKMPMPMPSYQVESYR
jgi:hypothetical protein